jgi:hypothetical protein
MSGEDAPRPCLENLIVPEIKTNKQAHKQTSATPTPRHLWTYPIIWTDRSVQTGVVPGLYKPNPKPKRGDHTALPLEGVV